MAGRVAIVLSLLIALAVAVLAYQSMSAPGTQTGSRSSPPPLAACAPAPCTDVQGFVLWVSNVSVSGNLVRMTVKFRNSSAATHASPQDLTLLDRTGHTSRITTEGSDCNTWTRHEFDHGATFGPIDICFAVSDSTPPFTLRWTPDLGFFCCDTQLTINPS